MWMEITGNENLLQLSRQVCLVAITQRLLTHYGTFCLIRPIEPEKFVEDMTKDLVLPEDSKDYILSLFNTNLLEQARERNAPNE